MGISGKAKSTDSSLSCFYICNLESLKQTKHIFWPFTCLHGKAKTERARAHFTDLLCAVMERTRRPRWTASLTLHLPRWKSWASTSLPWALLNEDWDALHTSTCCILSTHTLTSFMFTWKGFTGSQQQKPDLILETIMLTFGLSVCFRAVNQDTSPSWTRSLQPFGSSCCWPTLPSAASSSSQPGNTCHRLYLCTFVPVHTCWFLETRLNSTISCQTGSGL